MFPYAQGGGVTRVPGPGGGGFNLIAELLTSEEPGTHTGLRDGLPCPVSLLSLLIPPFPSPANV